MYSCWVVQIHSRSLYFLDNSSQCRVIFHRTSSKLIPKKEQQNCQLCICFRYTYTYHLIPCAHIYNFNSFRFDTLENLLERCMSISFVIFLSSWCRLFFFFVSLNIQVNFTTNIFKHAQTHKHIRSLWWARLCN